MGDSDLAGKMNDSAIEQFIAEWRDTGGSELANTQSFINGLCAVLGVHGPRGSRTDDAHNDYVFDCYKRDCFILEAKQGSEADRASVERNELDLDLFGQTAAVRVKRGTAKRGTPGWIKAMTQAKGQAERYSKALPADHGWTPFLLVCDVGIALRYMRTSLGQGRPTRSFPTAVDIA
jgi:hypothetical protein